MIDLHCHFLPGVDDGPETIAQALALARASVAQGIRAAVVTPHIHPGRYAADLATLEQAFAAFSARLVSENIPLEVRLGSELRLSTEAIDLLTAGRVPFLGEAGGYRVVLLEFPHETIPAGSLELVRHLISKKIRPLIAHPERNKTVMHNPEAIRPFVDAGAWLQLTAAAIIGQFGKASQRTAHYLLAEELAWLVATDAHNLEHRPPRLAEARSTLNGLVGDTMARRLVSERPARIWGV